MNAVAAVLAVALAGGATNRGAPPLVFGGDEQWLLVSRRGELIERIDRPCGLRANELAVSADLATLVVTAWSSEAQNSFLYVCERGASTARMLGEQTGYHAHPSFSDDGRWVYFVHHPHKGGPPGLHEPGANAQLYRVRLDGTELTALTQTQGCKLSPKTRRNTALYVHASCHGPRSIELFDVGKRKVIATFAESQVVHYADLSADGKSLLFTREVWDATQLVSLDVRSKAERVLWTLPMGYPDTRTAWGEGQRSVLFQKAGSVWKLTLGRSNQEEKLFDIGGAT